MIIREGCPCSRPPMERIEFRSGTSAYRGHDVPSGGMRPSYRIPLLFARFTLKGSKPEYRCKRRAVDTQPTPFYRVPPGSSPFAATIRSRELRTTAHQVAYLLVDDTLAGDLFQLITNQLADATQLAMSIGSSSPVSTTDLLWDAPLPKL